VPDDLSGLSRGELKRLRDNLISAATQQGGIDDRLQRVVLALRKAKRASKDEQRKERRKRKNKEGFKVSLGAVAGDQLKKMRRK
jgi:hypothetical protein